MARNFVIEEATRQGLKARIALAGPSGAGKTYSSLLIATELVGPKGTILVIDTERKSASLYADEFNFKTVDFPPPYDPRDLIELLQTHGAAFDAIVIDSLSHFWSGAGGILEIADQAGKGGNKFTNGWGVASPIQAKLIDTILSLPGHVICCTRVKQEYVLEKNAKGKTTPRRVGLKAVQKEDLIYEFTVYGEIDGDGTNRLRIEKSRCNDLANRSFIKGETKDFAGTLRDWLGSEDAIEAGKKMVEEIEGSIVEDYVAPEDEDQEAVKAIEVIGEGQATALKEMFASIDDVKAQKAAKKAFFDEFGNPDELPKDALASATAKVNELVDKVNS